MKLHQNDIHIWSARLELATENADLNWSYLSIEEQNRAQRLRDPILQNRFILAHAHLHQLLGRYLRIAPAAVQFEYEEHNKPRLASSHQHALEFNLSHSDDRVLYAFTLNTPIGIDIEGIKEEFKAAVAKRYFSSTEQQQLQALPPPEQARAFYHIWAKKEALSKATGKGLHLPFSSFSVAAHDPMQNIWLDNQKWVLLTLNTNKNFAAALAYASSEKELLYYQLD